MFAKNWNKPFIPYLIAYSIDSHSQSALSKTLAGKSADIDCERLWRNTVLERWD